MRVRAILFDLFDTLVDLHMEKLPEVHVLGRTVRSTHRFLHAVVARRCALDFETFARELVLVDRELRDASYARGLELPTLERFRALVERLALPAALAGELTAEHMARVREQARFLAHHRALLAELSQRARLGVCSNFSHAQTARELLAQAGLLSSLHAVVISEDVGYRKPRPEIFAEALRRLGAEPADALHVGDRLDADVAGAAALGIRAIWLTRRAPEAGQQLREHGGPPPWAVISDLAELPALLVRAGSAAGL